MPRGSNGDSSNLRLDGQVTTQTRSFNIIRRVEKLYKCKFCHRAFTSFVKKVHHQSLIHADEQPYKCPDCIRSFSLSCSLERHMLRHTVRRPFTCKICCVSFKRLSSIRVHILSHSCDKPFACKDCDKTFKWQRSLKQHITAVHSGDKPYKCPLCAKSFGRLQCMTMHLRVHRNLLSQGEVGSESSSAGPQLAAFTSTMPGTNDGLGASNSRASSQSHQLLKDSGLLGSADVEKLLVPRHECTFCGKKFFQRANCVRHMRTHTSDKPFACCKCPKRFRDASNMKVHLRTHTKCKPYKCDYCDCAFANYSSLKYHHKTNHAAERSIKYTRLPEPSIVDSSSIRCSINGVNCNRLENAVSSVLVNTVHRHAKDKVANIVSVNGGSAAAAESPTTVTCSYCESDFSSSEALTTHCLEVHVFQKLQQCKSCFTDLIRYVMDYSCCHAPGKPTLIELNNDANAVDQQSCETYDDDDDVDDDNDNEIGETRTAEQPPGSVGVKISAKKQRARPKVGNNQYKCWHCHSVFASLQTLREHRLQTHSHEKPYKCNICDKAYKRPDGLEIHMRSHTGEKPYSCPECHKAFAMSNSLKLHLQTHNSSKMFLCKDCGKALASAHTLRLHARLHTGEKPFKCLLCEKTFPRSDAMKSHLRSHRSDKQCSDLLAQMAGGVEKVSHLSTDAGEAVVHIPLFDAENEDGQKQDLSSSTSSMSTVTSLDLSSVFTKRFMCSECGKQFFAHSMLVRHLRTHTGEKPFKCTECEASFADQGNLKRHTRLHTGEKPYKCTECDRQFSMPHSLKVHQLSHKRKNKVDC